MEHVNELRNIVGRSNLSSDPGVRDSYSSDHSFARPCTPDCVVYAGSAAQVQEIVGWANHTKTPLVPVSSGEPRFRGDTVPSMGGVIVDLSRMNKVLMIDRTERVVMVEPGVRFLELQEAARREGLRVLKPLAPRRTKSVLTSALEREPHVLPKYHLDHSEPMLCTEVVYGTADRYRTGDAAGPGTLEEQWKAGRYQKAAQGIMSDEFRYLQAAQGTMGILTWATIRCEIQPTLQKPFLAASHELRDLLEFTRMLVRLRLGEEIFVLNNLDLALLIAENQEDVSALSASLPPWILFYCLAGYEHLPAERIAYQEKNAGEIAQRIGVSPCEAIGGVPARRVLDALDIPPETSWRLKSKGGAQEIPFITSFREISKASEIMKEVCWHHRHALEDLGVYVQPVCQGHGYHCEFTLAYDPESPGDRERTKRVYVDAAHRLMNNGAFFSRPYDLLTNAVLNRDAASREALRKLKDIYDPNRIMNPGKLVS